MTNSTARKPPAASPRNEIGELGALIRKLAGHRIDEASADGSLYRVMLAEFERPLLAEVLGRCANNQSRAAELLGLSRGTLRAKLRRHGLVGGGRA